MSKRDRTRRVSGAGEPDETTVADLGGSAEGQEAESQEDPPPARGELAGPEPPEAPPQPMAPAYEVKRELPATTPPTVSVVEGRVRSGALDLSAADALRYGAAWTAAGKRAR